MSHIYAPRFATLALVESLGWGGGGAYMWDLTFYLANTLPLPVPRLDVDIGTLYYRPIEAAHLPSLLILSSWSPEPQKLDGQDRLTEVGHSIDSGFVLSNVLLLTPLANTLAIDCEFLSCSMDAGFVLALPWGP